MIGRLLLVCTMMSGCSLMFGGTNAIECNINADCPDNERCQSGLCSPEEVILDSGLLDLTVDTGAADAVTLRPDLEVPPDMGQPAPYEDERCFPRDTGTVYQALEPSNFIPVGDCGSWAMVWTESTTQGEVLIMRQGADANSSPIRLDHVVGRHHLADRQLLVPRQNPVEDAVNIWRQDLVSGQGAFINPKGYDQRAVSRDGDYTTYIETRPDGYSRVQIQLDDDVLIDCGRPQHTQWGVVAAPTWVAWFEQRVGAQRARLVITQPGRCDESAQRRERLLPNRPLANSQLARAGDQLFWLERGPDGNNLVRIWQHRRQGAEPVTLPASQLLDGNPVEFAAANDHVAIISYRPASPQFRLDLLNVADGQVRPISTIGNVHRPTLTKHYLLWTRGSGATGWEVKYETLR